MRSSKPLSELTRGLAEQIRADHAAGKLPSYDADKPATPCDPECPTCKGQGSFLYDVPPGHPQYNKIQVCPNKPVNVANTGIADRYEVISWDDILPEGNAMQAVDAVMACIEKGFGWVYMWGKPGKAKTLILQRAVKEAVERGLTAKYTHTKSLLDELRSSFDAERKQESLTRQLNYLKSYRVLALDEFDRFNNTPWAQQEIFDLMDDRWGTAVRGQTVTLMASNSPETAYDDYLVDRIRDGRFTIVHLTGDSLRPAADRSMP